MSLTTLDDRFDVLLQPFFDAIDSTGEADALGAIERCRRRLDGARTRIASQRSAPEANQLLRRSGLSKTEAKKITDRGELFQKKPMLADKLESGEASAAQLDIIVLADRATNGLASVDDGFVADILGSSADGLRGKKNAFLNAQLSEADVERKHRFQRDNREVFKRWSDDGRPGILLEHDEASLAQVWTAVEIEAERMYRAEGGRDVAIDKQSVTWKQRMADAMVNVLTGQAAPSGSVAVVITLNADRLFLPDGMPLCEMVGTGPVPNSVVIDALKNDAELWTVLGEPTGMPIWEGRSSRTVSKAQLIAMIARDKGCIETREHWRRAHAHHTTPWSSPAQGETNVADMVLVSPTVHTDSHSKNYTWWWDRGIGRWRQRPYNPDEHVNPRPTGKVKKKAKPPRQISRRRDKPEAA